MVVIKEINVWYKLKSEFKLDKYKIITSKIEDR